MMSLGRRGINHIFEETSHKTRPKAASNWLLLVLCKTLLFRLQGSVKNSVICSPWKLQYINNKVFGKIKAPFNNVLGHQKFPSSLIGQIGFPTWLKIDFMNEYIFLIIPVCLYNICVRLILFLFEIFENQWSHLGLDSFVGRFSINNSSTCYNLFRFFTFLVSQLW